MWDDGGILNAGSLCATSARTCHAQNPVVLGRTAEQSPIAYSPGPQICDFGYSKHEKYQSAPGSRVGTPAYLAPEVIMTTKGKTYDGKVCWWCVCARFG